MVKPVIPKLEGNGIAFNVYVSRSKESLSVSGKTNTDVQRETAIRNEEKVTKMFGFLALVCFHKFWFTSHSPSHSFILIKNSHSCHKLAWVDFCYLSSLTLKWYINWTIFTRVAMYSCTLHNTGECQSHHWLHYITTCSPDFYGHWVFEQYISWVLNSIHQILIDWVPILLNKFCSRDCTSYRMQSLKIKTGPTLHMVTV